MVHKPTLCLASSRKVRPSGWLLGRSSAYRPAASCTGQHDLARFGQPRGIAQRLHDVLTFQVGTISQDVIDTVTRADLSDHHTDHDPHATNARLARPSRPAVA